MRALLLACALTLLGTAARAAVLTDVERSGDAFVVQATIDAEVSLPTAWAVLTDFDRMSAILSNLTASAVVRRSGNVLTVRQQGVAKYGPFSFDFQSEREVRLEPMQRIVARQIVGTLKRMDSEARLARTPQGVQIRYRAEIVPDSALARAFGAHVVQHEVEEQFESMLAEMRRRERAAPARP